MKILLRYLPIFAVIFATSLNAQDEAAARARAIADQQEEAERYKRLNAQIEDLLMANADLQRKIGTMENELRKTRAELLAEVSKAERKADENTGRFVTQDQLKKVVDAVNEAEKKRVEDDKKIVEEMRKLVKQIAGGSGASVSAPSQATRVNTETSSSERPAPNVPTKGFEHTVKQGEYLGSIIAAYNEALKEKGATKKITLDMVKKANPNLDPNRMAIGTKVFIPDPNQE